MECTHLDHVKVTETDQDVCDECIKAGDSWVHLRLCLSYGHVGCCDSSKNKHARKHFREEGHPLIRSAESGEEWAYCYIDKTYLNL